MARKRLDQPIKLFIDASPLAERNITGIPHFTAELVKALDQHPDNGKKFIIILVIAFDKKKLLGRWQYNNIKIKVLPLPLRFVNLFWKYDVLPPMDMILGKGRYLFPNYKNWRLSRSKSLTYIHDLGFMRYPQFVQPKNLEFLKNNIQKWIGRSDLILTGAEHARNEIIELLSVSPEKVVRIYHGVDHSDYYPRPKSEISSALSKYGLSGKYLLYIGSIEPRKNLSRLVSAYDNLPTKLKDEYSLCLIGGDGWLNNDILRDIELSKEKGNKIIRPNSYVEDEDLPALITGSSLLVHPALYEGFGLSPLQAMACGTPVLVGNNSSLPEVVGKAGTLVNAEDESDISAKIEKVLSDKKYRARMIELGLGQAQKFKWEISAQELLDNLYRLDD